MRATQKMMKALEDAQPHEFRPHIGASIIGDRCDLKIWLNFRFAARPHFPAGTLLKFDDGHASERITAQRLKMVDGIELSTGERDGQQFKYSILGGHFGGSVDGFITGVPQGPRSRMIWEHKCVDKKEFNKMQRAIDKYGEGKALEVWNQTYYTQAQAYMLLSGVFNHFITVATSGSREYLDAVTRFDAEIANQISDKAKDIIFCEDGYDRISTKPDKWPCAYCSNNKICHGWQLPAVTCRSCIHGAPAKGGKWACGLKHRRMNLDEQIQACDSHLYLPAIVNKTLKQIDVADDCITYEHKLTGKLIKNEVVNGRSNSLSLRLTSTSEIQ